MGFKLKKLLTVKGLVKYATPMGGVLQRSKKARKLVMIAGAAAGAYMAAPIVGKYAAMGYKSVGAMKFIPKIGAVAGNLAQRKLSPGQVNEQIEGPEQQSPMEENFYAGMNTNRDSSMGMSATGRVPYGTAASAGVGAGLSSCGARADVASIDYSGLVCAVLQFFV